MIDTGVEEPERVARGLVRLAQSHRQLCADFLRDHRDGMDTLAVAKFAARIRMFDRVIASASMALSNLPDDNNDRHAMLRATIDSMYRGHFGRSHAARSVPRMRRPSTATGCSRRELR